MRLTPKGLLSADVDSVSGHRAPFRHVFVTLLFDLKVYYFEIQGKKGPSREPGVTRAPQITDARRKLQRGIRLDGHEYASKIVWFNLSKTVSLP